MIENDILPIEMLDKSKFDDITYPIWFHIDLAARFGTERRGPILFRTEEATEPII